MQSRLPHDRVLVAVLHDDASAVDVGVDDVITGRVSADVDAGRATRRLGIHAIRLAVIRNCHDDLAAVCSRLDVVRRTSEI